MIEKTRTRWHVRLVGRFHHNQRVATSAGGDIYDTPDQHFSDMELFHSERLKGRDNIKLRRLLVDNTPPTFDRLLSLGLVFYDPCPNRRIPSHACTISCQPADAHPSLSKAASTVGVEIRPSTALEDLLVEQGRVTELSPMARKSGARGVILAAGDFSSNDTLKRYMPANMARIDGFNPASTGDWHDPVTALGGRILNGDVALGPEIRFRPPSKPTLVRKPPPGFYRPARALVDRSYTAGDSAALHLGFRQQRDAVPDLYAGCQAPTAGARAG